MGRTWQKRATTSWVIDTSISRRRRELLLGDAVCYSRDQRAYMREGTGRVGSQFFNEYKTRGTPPSQHPVSPLAQLSIGRHQVFDPFGPSSWDCARSLCVSVSVCVARSRLIFSSGPHSPLFFPSTCTALFIQQCALQLMWCFRISIAGSAPRVFRSRLQLIRACWPNN